MALLIAPTAA